MIKKTLFESLLHKQILILDGPMGTMIQRENLKEEDFRGERFKKPKVNLMGNNDILNISKPKLIYDIHNSFLEVGADILETNTFNSTMISQADYQCQDLSYELNLQGAEIAKKCVKDFLKKNPKQIKLVAGVLGPTNRTCSMSPDVNNPGFRNITFDELKKDYEISLEGLINGGVDVILIETVFDTLNAKAAIMAVKSIEKKNKILVPLMISATITDLSGRTLSGQTLEGFFNSVAFCNPTVLGLNCALGPKELEPHLVELGRISDSFISVHPNAGLPNAFGGYDETPDEMARYVKKWSDNNYINIVGGCCGTTPEHIKKMKIACGSKKPRIPVEKKNILRLSGLEPFNF